MVQALTEKGVPVRAVLHRPGGDRPQTGVGPEVCYADVRDAASWPRTMEGVDVVLHLVAVIRERRGLTFERVNHQGTANVVEAARQAGVQRVVQLSAVGAANDPSFPYLQSKWRGEEAVVHGGVPYTIIRSTVLFGDGDEFITTLAGVVKASPVVPIPGDGKTQFQPLHVQDLAKCIVQALDREDLRGRTVEVGGPTYMTYEEIIDTIAKTYGIRRRNVHMPMPIMRRLVWMMEKTLPHPPATSHQLRMLAANNVTQQDAVRRMFGFTPRAMGDNIDYISRISYTDALRTLLGFAPRRMRSH